MKKLSFVVVFAAGYLIMSLELLGSRILAPYFGNSIYIWAVLIGLILAALTAGYYFGGFLADKKNSEKNFLYIFLAASLFLLIDVFVYKAVLEGTAVWGIIWGAAAAVSLLFLPVMIVLAAAAPLAVKLLAREEEVGLSSGSVYALGTAGSLLGIFLTVFWLIPYFGSRLALFSCFFISLVVFSALLFWFGRKKEIILAILALAIALPALPKTILPKDVILEAESIYNQIRLIDRQNAIYLTLNTNKLYLINSAYIKRGTLFDFSLIDLFNLGPAIAPVKNLLILGMSGGASIRQHQQFSPEMKIDAVEIDPKIIEIAKNKFGIEEGDDLKIYEADARPFLAASRKKYEMIEIDLFQGSPYTPFYVLTQEFFQSAYSHLSDNGIVMMNIYAPAKHELLQPVLSTIASVFPSVYSVPVYGHNFVVVASRSPLGEQEIKSKISGAKIPLELKPVGDYFLGYVEKYQNDKNAPVFTDDWAPIETITYQMIKGVPELN
ncbi:MAG: fused MFS/spermidine synthase [Candidatus Portnoybacteria bacterium]|nr:fused MFS/spermidine synthase [Candidatus Portnoybacteria bacterium]MDD4982732.1 fused MFS/spermidine synthase [Candidatus Portnoybacteria bacterium]